MPQDETTAEGLVGLLLRLRGHGISDPKLLECVEATPHQNFVPVEYFDKAWSDCSLPIACGQTMPSPDLSIRLVAALMVEPTHAVLELGTGSGYQTALLSRLAKKVQTVDRYQSLLNNASQKLALLDRKNVTFTQMDATSGEAAEGLYDRIIADTCYDAMPRHLLEQLVSGGVVITAIGERAQEQTIVRLTKIGSRFERENLFTARLGMFETGKAEAL